MIELSEHYRRYEALVFLEEASRSDFIARQIETRSLHGWSVAADSTKPVQVTPQFIFGTVVHGMFQ